MASRRSKSLAQRSNDTMTLIIDKTDNYSQMENYFYINPSNLNKIKSLTNEQFHIAKIKNIKPQEITPLFLTILFTKMKINGTVEVIISEPISVMQSYEAKIIEANAKIGGFTDIKTIDSLFLDERVNKKIPTLSVTFKRPLKRGNLQEEIYKQDELRREQYNKMNKSAAMRRKSNEIPSGRRISKTNQDNNKNDIPSGRRISKTNQDNNKNDIPSGRRISKTNQDNNKNDIPSGRRISKPSQENLKVDIPVSNRRLSNQNSKVNEYVPVNANRRLSTQNTSPSKKLDSSGNLRSNARRTTESNVELNSRLNKYSKRK
jgi:hypothetical protein